MEIGKKPITYSQAGVDREAADRLVDRIGKLAKSTLNSKVKGSVGGYASLYEWDAKTFMAASTDGVGTKLKLAGALQDHSTVGIDLVAMSVNDLICVGAEPLIFLDYFATGKLKTEVAAQVIQGIVEGCKQAKCALVGGETAEMPDFYDDGEYDLAGFAVGRVSKKLVLPKSKIKPGTKLIGIASSGCHSNGFSLIRKLLDRESPGAAKQETMKQLLAPTKIYVKSVMPLLDRNMILGLAHITGSGFLNVPRISSKVSYRIELPTLKQVAPVYTWVRAQSGLGIDELGQTFNMGVGMVLAVEPKKVKLVLSALKKAKERAWEIGEVIPKGKNGCGIDLGDPETGTRAWLNYES